MVYPEQEECSYSPSTSTGSVISALKFHNSHCVCLSGILLSVSLNVNNGGDGEMLQDEPVMSTKKWRERLCAVC